MKAGSLVLKQRKFRIKFPERPVPIRRLAKRFIETGSIKNRNVNHRLHVLTEETLNETGKRTYLPKISKKFITGNLSLYAICTESNKITETEAI